MLVLGGAVGEEWGSVDGVWTEGPEGGGLILDMVILLSRQRALT